MWYEMRPTFRDETIEFPDHMGGGTMTMQLGTVGYTHAFRAHGTGEWLAARHPASCYKPDQEYVEIRGPQIKLRRAFMTLADFHTRVPASAYTDPAGLGSIVYRDGWAEDEARIRAEWTDWVPPSYPPRRYYTERPHIELEECVLSLALLDWLTTNGTFQDVKLSLVSIVSTDADVERLANTKTIPGPTPEDTAHVKAARWSLDCYLVGFGYAMPIYYDDLLQPPSLPSDFPCTRDPLVFGPFPIDPQRLRLPADSSGAVDLAPQPSSTQMCCVM